VAPLKVLPCQVVATARVYPFGFGGDRDHEDEAEEDAQSGPTFKVGKKPSDKLEPGYSDLSQQYATYLTTLKRPEGMDGLHAPTIRRSLSSSQQI
jgi:hypothetical protein